jgi:hypothetical protein
VFCLAIKWMQQENYNGAGDKGLLSVCSVEKRWLRERMLMATMGV